MDQLADELWQGLLREAQSAGMPIVDERFCYAVWLRLDGEQRQRAVNHIRFMRTAGYYQDARYVPTLDRYLEYRRWGNQLPVAPKMLDQYGELAMKLASLPWAPRFWKAIEVARDVLSEFPYDLAESVVKDLLKTAKAWPAPADLRRALEAATRSSDQTCEDCDGTGWDDRRSAVCRACNGLGVTRREA